LTPTTRLARNNADWHRLLELAALSRTLILDEGGIYDPSNFNDPPAAGFEGLDERSRIAHLEVAPATCAWRQSRRGLNVTRARL